MKALGFLPVGDIGRIVGPGEGATHTHGRDATVNTGSPPVILPGSSRVQGPGKRLAGSWFHQQRSGAEACPLSKVHSPFDFWSGFC